MITRQFEEYLSIQRLPWAGALFETNNYVLVIDPLASVPDAIGGGLRIKHWGAVEDIQADAVLITHTRNDHYDAEVLRKVLKPGGVVVSLSQNERDIKDDGFDTIGLDTYASVALGPFTVTALPAVDGLGAHRASYLLEIDEIRVLHSGDSLWHGYWYKWATDYGPLSVTLLPINGATVAVPGVTDTNVPAVLTPQQAAAAADVLCSQLVIPTHYGCSSHPHGFKEQPDALGDFEREASQRNLNVRALEPGQEVELDRAPPTAD